MNIKETIEESFKNVRDLIPASALTTDIYSQLMVDILSIEEKLILVVEDKCYDTINMLSDYREDNSMELGEVNYASFLKLEEKIYNQMF